MIVRALLGTLALLLGTATLLLLLELLSERHSPGGYILLVTIDAACFVAALALLGVFLKRPARHS
jgi:hypothetical protein